jgi:hypothetical protein
VIVDTIDEVARIPQRKRLTGQKHDNETRIVVRRVLQTVGAHPTWRVG